MSKTVTIVQRRLTHYRVPLFERMRALLRDQQIELRLMHGDATAAETMKHDGGSLPWAEHLATHYWAGGRLCYQPFWSRAKSSELVIVTPENKHLNNLPLLVNPWRRTGIAFWGHGRNMQSTNPDGALERFKRWTNARVDWWFAYTELTAGLVREDGFPADRITVLNNSIDTSALAQAVAQARATPRPELRARLGVPADAPMAVYLGSLYSEKRIPWLLQAAAEVQRQLPGFHLVLAGDGPDRALVQQAAAERPYLHYAGSVQGAAKAELLAAADVMLNPGLVGLGILDAFVAGLPLLTTDCHLHSPEIAYLQSGVNGLMTADNPATYVRAVVDSLTLPATLQSLSAGAQAAATHYSIENMAQRFCDGISAQLDAKHQKVQPTN